MDDDWDLQAVVRGYTTTTTTTTTKTDVVASLSSFQTIQHNQNSGFPDLLFQPRTQSVNEELHDLYKPFFPKIQSLPLSSFSVLRGLQDLSQQQQQKQHQQQKEKQLHTKQSVVGTKSVVSTATTASRLHQSPRSKKRKNQMKKVCQVPAEGLSSDMWSWRKYGQKPIKGSPYPRGYYRCSTSKGCLARKQVERNRSDPTMFIITYTGDHNHSIPTHRNSLAGSTRHKPTTGDDAGKPTCSSPAASLSPATENINSLEEERDNIGGGEEDDYDFVSDDFFEGLDEISGDSFLDQFPASLPFPRLAAGGS